MTGLEGLPGGALPFLTALWTCLLVTWGLGGWTGDPRAGGRLAGGAALLILSMVGLNFGLRMPLSAAVVPVGIAAAAGIIFRPGRGIGELSRHPALWLPVLVSAAVLWRGGLSYQPYSWDEFSAWLYWPREAFLRDDGAAASDWRSLGYTQGLVLASLFPQLLFERFDQVRLLAFPLGMHVALLALVFDITLARTRSLPTAWALVLGLLGVEVTWTLVPQLAQAEKPQIYLFSMIFLLMSEVERDRDLRRANATTIGLVMAGGFLVKSGFIGVFPPVALALAWLVLRRGEQGPRDWLSFALVVLPLLLTIVVWGQTKGAVRGGCLGDPVAAIFTAAGNNRPPPLDMARRLAAGIGEYLLAYKPWLSLLALAGLGLAVARGRRVTVLALAGFVAIYLLSLHVVYNVCLGSGEGAALASLPRYLRVPLRVVHATGVVLLVLEGLAVLRHGLRVPISPRWVRAGMLGGIVLLAGWQIGMVARSLDNVETRSYEGDGGELQKRLARDTEAVARHLTLDGRAWVTMLAQGSSGEEFTYARYYAMGRGRGDPVNRFEVAHEFSFAASPVTPWTTEMSEGRTTERLGASHLLWPQRPLDPWLMGALRPLMDDSICLERALGKVMVRGADGRFTCRPLYMD